VCQVADVEQVAAVVARENPSFRVEVGDVGDVGAHAQLGAGVVRIDLERAEEPAEGKLLPVGHRLPRKDKDAVTIERRVDLGKDFGHYRAREIDAAHLGAEGGMKRGQRDRHWAAPG